MKLTRKAFQQLLALDKVNWDQIEEHTKRAAQVKLETVLDRLPQLEEIEGVQNLAGAKYLIQQRAVSTLEKLGVTVDNSTLDAITIAGFLEGETLATV